MWVNAIAAVSSMVVFVLGLKVMRDGLDGMASGRLPSILKRLVRTPTRGILTGTFVTMLTQSSSAVTAICVSMVSSGTMIFRDAVGVVLGANVGSTITPQILTLNLWGLMIPFLILGGVGYFSRKASLRSPSLAIIGFSCIYIALQAFSTASTPFAEEDWFARFLLFAGQSSLIAALFGAVASAIFQSSTAITVMTMTFAAEGLIPLSGSIAIVLGANVGTCVTSVVAAMGQRREAGQVALAHVILNVAGVLVALPLLHLFTHFVAALENDPSRQVADAHTLFNVLSTLVLWPVVKLYARFIQWLYPASREEA